MASASARLFVTVTCALTLLAGTSAQSVPSKRDRDRIRVAVIPDALGGDPLKVLRTDRNTPLRAGTAWIWSKQWQEEPASYYAALRGKGFNAVRIILFDTWEHEAGYGGGDWNDPSYRNAMLGRLERAVNHCSQHGLYAIINSHNKIPQYDVTYSRALWTHVAPYFQHRKHVIFEASNEPLEGTLINAQGVYGGSMPKLSDLRGTHDLIRSLAPNAHIMVLTPAGVSGWGYVDGLARLTRTFAELPGTPIDWSKTSVAYHLYHADESLFPQAENLRAFHRQYPGWPSENNFPSTLTNQQLGITDSWRSVSFGTDVFVTQTTERLGLGWSHWNINRQTQLDQNFPYIWADAVAKGYAWEPDPVVNPIKAINAGGDAAGSYHPDTNYFGGQVASNDPTASVDTSRAIDPPPASAFATERWGNFTYQVAGLQPGLYHRVRLHFNEAWNGITQSGQRVFNVYANNGLALSQFDIFAEAGGRNRAITREVRCLPDAEGRITIRFESVIQNAKVDAIHVFAERRRGRR
jgi:aryl-phospho-beta-D-glucosidase BglC (GH1 family)